MRFLQSYILLGGLLLGTVACDRPDTAEDKRVRQEKVDEAAHKAGAAAYKAAQKTKLGLQSCQEVKPNQGQPPPWIVDSRLFCVQCKNMTCHICAVQYIASQASG